MQFGRVGKIKTYIDDIIGSGLNSLIQHLAYLVQIADGDHYRIGNLVTGDFAGAVGAGVVILRINAVIRGLNIFFGDIRGFELSQHGGHSIIVLLGGFSYGGRSHLHAQVGPDNIGRGRNCALADHGDLPCC